MSVRISRAIHDQLIAIAAAHPDEEACGLLFGTANHVTAMRQTTNVSSAPKDRFEIDPLALIAAHKNVRSGGALMIGHFHSHPNGVLAPSARDAAAAIEPLLWIIIANATVGAWRCITPGEFAAIVLEIDE